MPLGGESNPQELSSMPEFIQETQQEFWRPPVLTEAMPIREVMPAMAEACPRCGTEFLVGSRFCHCCGGRRPDAMSATAKADALAFARWWEKAVAHTHSAIAGIPWNKIRLQIAVPAWLHNLRFDEVQRRIGLPTAPLIAFVIGLGCVTAALLVGLFTAKTLVDWQAIQFYRVEWLLAATASFVAGILLKKPSGRDSN